jgi:hypothetical protein
MDEGGGGSGCGHWMWGVPVFLGRQQLITKGPPPHTTLPSNQCQHLQQQEGTRPRIPWNATASWLLTNTILRRQQGVEIRWDGRVWVWEWKPLHNTHHPTPLHAPTRLRPLDTDAPGAPL